MLMCMDLNMFNLNYLVTHDGKRDIRNVFKGWFNTLCKISDLSCSEVQNPGWLMLAIDNPTAYDLLNMIPFF